MKKVIVIILLMAAAAGGAFWWRAAHREKPVRILAAEEVGRGTVRKVLEEAGIVKAQVGAIERMLVKVGDRVRKDQLAQAEAQLAQSRGRGEG